jgi:hypothetical protein
MNFVRSTLLLQPNFRNNEIALLQLSDGKRTVIDDLDDVVGVDLLGVEGPFADDNSNFGGFLD